MYIIAGISDKVNPFVLLKASLYKDFKILK